MNHHTWTFKTVPWISLMARAAEWAKRVITVSVQMACSIFAFINIYGSSLNNPLLIIEACFKLVSIMPNTCYHLALTLTAFFFYFLLPSSLLLAQPSRSKFKSSCNNQYFSCIALCIPPDTRIGIKFSVLRVLDCISIILESI